MNFTEKLFVNQKQALLYLGYKNTKPDDATSNALQIAAKKIENTSRPLYTWAIYSLAANNSQHKITLANAQNTALEGNDIYAHLSGCESCIFLAVTLGSPIDGLIRTASVADMHESLLLDTCASVLAEQYADAACSNIKNALGSKLYITPRFSPGYGDFPISFQKEFSNILDTRRAIGLSVSNSGILLPRKSISAVIGVANKPVSGKLANCENCALKGKCNNNCRIN